MLDLGTVSSGVGCSLSVGSLQVREVGMLGGKPHPGWGQLALSWASGFGTQMAEWDDVEGRLQNHTDLNSNPNCNLPAAWPWISYLISLGLSFLIFKIGI